MSLSAADEYWIEAQREERARIAERLRGEIARMEYMQERATSIQARFFSMGNNAADALRTSHYRDGIANHCWNHNRIQGCQAYELQWRRAQRIAQARRDLRLVEDPNDRP